MLEEGAESFPVHSKERRFRVRHRDLDSFVENDAAAKSRTKSFHAALEECAPKLLVGLSLRLAKVKRVVDPDNRTHHTNVLFFPLNPVRNQ
jgi:hypothetical protein